MIPIQMRRRVFGGKGSARRVLADAYHGPFQTAEPPSRHRLARQAFDVVAAVARANLKNTPRLADHPHQQLALVHRQGQRFFTVDVLARLAGGDRHRGMPVVGRADEHDVHVRAFEQLAVVLVQRRLATEMLDRLLADLPVDIADRHDVAERDRMIGVHGALILHADRADADPVIFRFRLTLRRRVRSEVIRNHRPASSNGGRQQKRTARKLVGSHLYARSVVGEFLIGSPQWYSMSSCRFQPACGLPI
jgi:hypothetical protein